MENSHSETRLILSLSLQDIDNLAKERTNGTGRCFAFRTCQRMELQPQYSHPFPEGTGGRRTRQSQHG